MVGKYRDSNRFSEYCLIRVVFPVLGSPNVKILIRRFLLFAVAVGAAAAGSGSDNDDDDDDDDASLLELSIS